MQLTMSCLLTPIIKLWPLFSLLQPFHQLPIILRWVTGLFGSMLKMWLAWCIVVRACMSRSREWDTAYHEVKTRRNQQVFDVLVLHSVMLYCFIYLLGVYCQCLILNYVNFAGKCFVSRMQQLHAVILQWFLFLTLNINRVGLCSMSCAVAHILHYTQLPHALYPCLFKLWWGLWLPFN